MYVAFKTAVEFDSSVGDIIVCGGVEDGEVNQLLEKSKKQWSLQWQDEAKSMRRRKEQ